MKEAEDHAIKLRRHAQYQRNLSNNYEMEIAQLASKETERWHSEQSVNNYDNKGYGGLTSIDFSDQMSKASEVSFGNSRTSAMGYGGIHGVSQPSVDDASALMGGSTGYGDGVYASSTYGGSVTGSYSVSDSINNVQGASVSYNQGGYVSDAASQSVASELLNHSIYSNNNSGHTGSINNFQPGYSSDVATRSVASEVIHPSYASISGQPQMHGGYSSDGGIKNKASENMYSLQQMALSSDENYQTLTNTATTSNDTEQMNNVTSTTNEAQHFDINTSDIQQTNVPSLEEGGSNDFGSFIIADNNQPSSFDGIPTPEKQINHPLNSRSSESFDFTLLRNEEQENSANDNPLQQPITTSPNVEEITSVSVNENEREKFPEETNIAQLQQSIENDNFIPSPKENEKSLYTNFYAMTEKVAVKEESMSKNDETSIVMTKSSDDGLIPSPSKNETGSFSGDITHINGNTGINNDRYSMISAMSLNADSVGISNLNNNFGMMNLGNANQQTIEGAGLGIMSNSTDGGIPTPTASKDEFEQAHW